MGTAAEWWMAMAERIGIPMTILFFFGIAVWIGLKWLAKRIFEPMVKAHVELVEEIKKTSSSNTKTLGKVSETLVLATKGLEGLDQRNTHMFSMVESNTKRLDQLAEGGCPIIKGKTPTCSVNGSGNPVQLGVEKKG